MDFEDISQAIPGQVVDWDEELTPEDWVAFEQLVTKLNPKIQDPYRIRLETVTADSVRRAQAMPKHLRTAEQEAGITARAARGCGPQDAGNLGQSYANSVAGLGRFQEVPKLMVVVGHPGNCNVVVNGIYERLRDDFHGRPVWCKILEKTVWKEKPTPAWVLRLPTTQKERDRLPFLVPDEPQPPTDSNGLALEPPDKESNVFIFFDDRKGCWCIGPKVGVGEIYARCPGVEEVIPNRLNGWQLWDLKRNEWYDHEAFLVTKSGKLATR